MKTDKTDSARNKSAGRKNKDKDESTKRPFDKKTYRLRKYSNKYKVDQWEERRRKSVLRGYYKELEKDQKERPRKPSHPDKESGEQERPSGTPQRGNAFFAAKKEFQKKKEEKQKRRDEALRVKTEKEEALKKYRERKALKYKRLSKKTRKGQPVMKDRLEMLLEKIQQDT